MIRAAPELKSKNPLPIRGREKNVEFQVLLVLP